MHVNPAGVEKGTADLAEVDALVSELSEARLNAEKAGVRGIIAHRLEIIWRQCEPFIVNSVGDGLDIRMAKLGLDVLDRMIKVHEVLTPDRPVKDEAVDEKATLARREAVLADLAALMEPRS